jgi:hypothetical protein
MMRVTGLFKNASLVPAKCNQPRCAAQQTAAAGVSDRSPVKQPRTKQRRSKVTTLATHLSLDTSTVTHQRSFSPLHLGRKVDQHSQVPCALLAYPHAEPHQRAHR